ncbi:MAG TPA: glutamine synthetase family protein [Kiloniellales bacterium]
MTAAETIEAFMAKLEDGGFEYVRFELPDLHGTARAKTVPVGKAEGYARRGLNFYGGILALDTASMVVPGSGLHEERNYADSKLFPDPASLTPVPWREGTARVICDVTFQDGTPIEAAPRRVLARLLRRAAGLGYNVLMGHEFEFYLLDAATKQQFFQGLHIFNVVRNEYLPLVEVLVDQLRAMGVDIITANCEYAGSQYEINFGPGLGLAAADKAYAFKNACKEIAHRHGAIASFMTKPWADKAGSGCHLHISLWNRETGANAFLDPADEAGLSPVARAFIAGLLAHAPAMMALANPTANCYHRLKPYTFAPSNVSWGIEDRTALVRIKGAGDETCHVEMRGGGAASNPYLTAAGTLAAGLLGIEQQLELAPEVAGPCESDPSLPKLAQSLGEALDGLAADAAMREALGEDFVRLFTTVKRFELARFRAHVTDWERDEYLEIH